MSGLDDLGIGSVYQLILWQMPCFVLLYSGGSRGGTPLHTCLFYPPTAQNFLNFMQFFRKFWQNHMLEPPPRRVGAPSYGESCIRPCYIYLQCSLLFRSWDVNKYGIRCQLAKGIIFYLRFFTAVQLDSLAVRASSSRWAWLAFLCIWL